MLPISLRNQMQPILKDGFYIKKSYYKECLELYPANQWEKVMGELDEKSRYDEEVDDFIRIFTAGLRPVEVDGTGRLLIAKEVMNMAGISKNVKIAPIRKHLEIWDLETYEEAVKASKERKKELAGKVMLPKPKAKAKDDVS